MKLNKIALVLAVLLFPSLLYVVLSSGKHHIDKMEHIGPEIDSGYYKVPNAEFMTHLGDSISMNDLEGNIFLLYSKI